MDSSPDRQMRASTALAVRRRSSQDRRRLTALGSALGFRLSGEILTRSWWLSSLAPTIMSSRFSSGIRDMCSTKKPGSSANCGSAPLRDEEAIAGWRSRAGHRAAQSVGRKGVFRDYRLRVAAVVRDYGMSERREQAPAESRAIYGVSGCPKPDWSII